MRKLMLVMSLILISASLHAEQDMTKPGAVAIADSDDGKSKTIFIVVESKDEETDSGTKLNAVKDAIKLLEVRLNVLERMRNDEKKKKNDEKKEEKESKGRKVEVEVKPDVEIKPKVKVDAKPKEESHAKPPVIPTPTKPVIPVQISTGNKIVFS